MVEQIWAHGQAVIVTVTGPGKIHLLSYNPSMNHPTMVGTVQARPQGTTRFLVSHSYGFFKYAFYWEGGGDAVASYGPVNRTRVGNSWNEAICIDWGSSNFTFNDVTSNAAVASENATVTCFVIPEL